MYFKSMCWTHESQLLNFATNKQPYTENFVPLCCILGMFFHFTETLETLDRNIILGSSENFLKNCRVKLPLVKVCTLFLYINN